MLATLRTDRRRVDARQELSDVANAVRLHAEILESMPQDERVSAVETLCRSLEQRLNVMADYGSVPDTSDIRPEWQRTWSAPAA